MDARFLIIGGAEKAGTTSVHTYLAAHPGVCASAKKETDYFRSPVKDLDRYLAYFSEPPTAGKVMLESSPGYLAEAEAVAPRMAELLPDARLVFLLRDPVDRLKSAFRYYKGRLHIPQAMGFEQFIEVCFDHLEGRTSPEKAGISRWHLTALERGRYEERLQPFRRRFAPQQLLLVAYDDLRSDARQTVQRIAAFAGLDPSFFDGYAFERENVSFYAKGRFVHRMAIILNDSLETIWRRNPQLKRALLKLYKRVNEKELEQETISDGALQRLQAYYAPTYRELESLRADRATSPAPGLSSVAA